MQSLGSAYRAVVFGASGGIGAAFVRALANDPACASVVGLSRRSDPAIELLDEDTIADAAAWVASRLGTVSLLIDATGELAPPGGAPEKRLDHLDPAVMTRLFQVNALGPALLFKHFLPLMPRRERAVFATLSARVGSIADNRRGGWISYRTSKAALNQIVKTVSIEVAFQRRLAVCVGLQPGTVDTPLSAPYRAGHETLTPDESVARLLGVLDGLTPDDSGGLYDHAGEAIPG